MGSRDISVLMSVYNCENTIESAVASIRNQTYPYWKLIICDDGSTDSTCQICERIARADDRIIVLQNGTNKGLSISLNRCLSVADGDYIARMDGDDLCMSDRFEKQIQYLEEHNSIDIVSSWMSLFDENGEWGVSKVPEFPTSEQVVTGNPICHAPAMMRRSCLVSVGGYSEDPRTLRVEDVNLWIKLYAAGSRAYNIQEPLYKMRNDQNALNRRKYKYRVNSVHVRLQGCRLLGLGPIYYLKSLRPMIIGLVPAGLRRVISRRIKRTA